MVSSYSGIERFSKSVEIAREKFVYGPNGGDPTLVKEGHPNVVCYSLERWQKYLVIAIVAQGILATAVGFSSLGDSSLLSAGSARALVAAGIGSAFLAPLIAALYHHHFVKQVEAYLAEQDPRSWQKATLYQRRAPYHTFTWPSNAPIHYGLTRDRERMWVLAYWTQDIEFHRTLGIHLRRGGKHPSECHASRSRVETTAVTSDPFQKTSSAFDPRADMEAKAATKIQSVWRMRLARNKLLAIREKRSDSCKSEIAAAPDPVPKALPTVDSITTVVDVNFRKGFEEAKAATKIQSAWRMRLARNNCRILREIRSGSRQLEIVDAKEYGLNWIEVYLSVSRIEKNELAEDMGLFQPSAFVQEEYFDNTSIEPGLCSPEFILLARDQGTIIGFIIAGKREVSEDEEDAFSLRPDTGYIAYIAVDSSRKRVGAGTQLMWAAAKRMKEMGKRYLTLEYIAEGLGIDKERGKAKKSFYNRFSTKFGIPMEEKGNTYITRALHIFPHYDLKDFESNYSGFNLN